jgi:hypothetical protein
LFSKIKNVGIYGGYLQHNILTYSIYLNHLFESAGSTAATGSAVLLIIVIRNHSAHFSN